MGERVTIRDVAARAGVSVATVSRVLAGNYATSAGARTKVLRAVKDLDYVINPHARALAGAGRKTVAVLISQVTSPFYAKVAQGVEEESAKRDRLCLVCTTGGDPARELAVVQMMREQAAEAVVLVGGVAEDDEYRARMSRYAQSLAAAGSRLVLCGRPAPSPDVPAIVVEYDNEAGAHAITSYLLGAGHRDIVLLGFEPGHTTGEARVSGYRRALAEHGLPPGRPGCTGHTSAGEPDTTSSGHCSTRAADGRTSPRSSRVTTRARRPQCVPCRSTGSGSPMTSRWWVTTTIRSPGM